MLEKINAILDFWFGEDKTNPLANAKKWWTADPAFDAEIKTRFEPLIGEAKKGTLDSWKYQPLSCLALIILLDQFSRNVYRSSSEAFAQDPLALEVSEIGREHKLDKELNLVQRQFFYMPLEHSEDIQNQRLCLALMQHLVQEARESQPEYLVAMEQAFYYAQRHYDVIKNFGRFPHRNTILNRKNTQAELLYLELANNEH